MRVKLPATKRYVSLASMLATTNNNGFVGLNWFNALGRMVTYEAPVDDAGSKDINELGTDILAVIRFNRQDQGRRICIYQFRDSCIADLGPNSSHT